MASVVPPPPSTLAGVRAKARLLIPLVRDIVDTIDRAICGEKVDEFADQWAALGSEKSESIRVVRVSVPRRLRLSRSPANGLSQPRSSQPQERFLSGETVEECCETLVSSCREQSPEQILSLIGCMEVVILKLAHGTDENEAESQERRT